MARFRFLSTRTWSSPCHAVATGPVLHGNVQPRYRRKLLGQKAGLQRRRHGPLFLRQPAIWSSASSIAADRARTHTHTHTQNWHASSTTPAGHGQEARRWAVITTTRECAVPSPMTWEGCMDMSDPSAGDIILNRGRRCRFRGRRHRQRPGGKPPERRACRGRLWAGWIVGARRFTGRAASRASNAVNLAALVGMANGIRAAVYLTRGGGRVPVESIRWHETPASEVLTRLNSDVNGLTEHEVSRRAVDSANGAFPTRPSLAASSRSWPTR
jgi:hypothetical protein